AQRLGINRQSLIRAQAGVRHVLQEHSGEGHCAAFRHQLIKMAVKLLEIPENIIEQAIEAELAERNLISELIDGHEALFSMPLYRAQKGCTKHLLRLKAGALPWGDIDASKAIPWVEKRTGLVL